LQYTIAVSWLEIGGEGIHRSRSLLRLLLCERMSKILGVYTEKGFHLILSVTCPHAQYKLFCNSVLLSRSQTVYKRLHSALSIWVPPILAVKMGWKLGVTRGKFTGPFLEARQSESTRRDIPWLQDRPSCLPTQSGHPITMAKFHILPPPAQNLQLRTPKALA
jgi:hypothetical protein